MNNLLRYSQYYLSVLLLSLMFTGSAFAAKVLKDPTRPLMNINGGSLDAKLGKDQKKSNTSLILQGVLVENGRKIAVVNNQLVRVGEEVEGYTVTGIHAYGAQLSLEEETLSLSLVSENIKISR